MRFFRRNTWSPTCFSIWMLWIIFIFACVCTLTCAFCSEKVDQAALKLWGFLCAFLCTEKRELAPEIYILNRLQSQLRGGMSLDSALEKIQLEPGLSPSYQLKIQAVLAARPQKDFLSDFLYSALLVGSSIVEPISLIHKNLTAQRRLQLKAKAFSSQSRAQAEVLTWLPWFLLLTLAILDFEWALSAINNPISWILWSIAILLTGLGKKWIGKQIKLSTEPINAQDKLLEEALPDLSFRILSQVSIGNDPQTSLERSLEALNNESLNKLFTQPVAENTAPEILHLRSIIFSSQGSPVRVELLQLVADLQTLKESRWEERVQKLPVLCLAPLFCCFFPACILVLMSLIIPMLKDLA